MPFWGHRVAKELGSRCITGSNSVDGDPFLAEGPRKIVGPANDCCLGGGIRAPSTPKCCNRTHVDDSPSRSPETGQKRLCQHHGSKDVASEIAKPGEVVSITIEILTREDFVKDLPTMMLLNDGALSWAPRTAEITGFVLAGEDLQISLSQDPAPEGVSSYVIDGTAQESLGFNGGMTYLDFQVIDVFGQPRDMRVIYNGYDPVRFGVLSGPDY